jgi:hypothetical protein
MARQPRLQIDDSCLRRCQRLLERRNLRNQFVVCERL